MRRTIAIGLLLITGLATAGAPDAGAQAAAAPAAGREAAVLRGSVTDAKGQALAGVAVKIFEEGFLLAETTSGPDGSYELSYGYLPEIDWTLVAWFVPAGDALIPEIYVLRESLKSKTRELWSACMPRVEIRSSLRIDAKLLDRDAKLQQMGECMGK